jgi:toxin HigB-1
MIRSARDKRIGGLRTGVSFKGFPPDLVSRTQRRIAQLDAADSLADLRVPPSNRLEMLKGDSAGVWSIRIDDQWRVCFVWKDGDAFDVEIVDYH